MVNDMSENIYENIKKIAKNFKRVHIVTNHMEKFKKIEKLFFEEEGIMITVGNNKRKSLSKSKVIINIDFPSELINEYNVFDEAIIITLRKNIKIKSKRFNGKIIDDYEITLKHNEEIEYKNLNKYNLKEIYEAQFYKKQPFENIMKKIEKDKVKVILQ